MTQQAAQAPHPNVIAQAWDTVQEQKNLSQKDVDRIVRAVAQETADLAQIKLDQDFQTIDLGKGFSITNQTHIETPDGPLTQGFVIARSANGRDITAVIGAAPGQASQPPALRDPQTPSITIPWTPEDGDQEEWMLNALRSRVAQFLTQNA